MYWNVNCAKKSLIYIIILVFIFYPPSATKPKALVHKDHTDPCTVINYMRKLRNILLQESRILNLTIIITGFKTKFFYFWQTFFDIFLQCTYRIVFLNWNQSPLGKLLGRVRPCRTGYQQSGVGTHKLPTIGWAQKLPTNSKTYPLLFWKYPQNSSSLPLI